MKWLGDPMPLAIEHKHRIPSGIHSFIEGDYPELGICSNQQDCKCMGQYLKYMERHQIQEHTSCNQQFSLGKG